MPDPAYEHKIRKRLQTYIFSCSWEKVLELCTVGGINLEVKKERINEKSDH